MLSRPSAPTPTTSFPASHDDWSSDIDQQSAGVVPSSAYVVDSPTSLVHSTSPTAPLPQNTLVRSPSEEDSAASDSGYSHTSTRSPNASALPDPSQFPDPYPYRPPHWQHGSSTPALSSADSSSGSTRSSAYTNSAKSGDYGHVHVASGGDEPSVGVGITTDDVVQLLSREPGVSAASQGRFPADQTRWSDFYVNSVRSRSSSIGNGMSEPTLQENGVKGLRATPSFDLGFETLDERDEAGLISEEETDDYLSMDEDERTSEEEPTSAMLIAEEGRGIIVRADDVPIVRLQVKTGTTHLLIGSSNTPNAVPSFLANTLPQIASTLLALDISANFLVALPPSLVACKNLEELNIASNPLRALPVFLSHMVSLRVLIVDSTGISTLPEVLSSLDRLHTLSIRRNKLNALPSWLCLLPALETLLVDGNPFHGPWKALIEPLLAKSPMTPLYPPSTPIFPLPSASVQSTNTDDTDCEDESPYDDGDRQLQAAQEDEDTITPAKSPPIARSVTSPLPATATEPAIPPKLTRTRTTPNRAYYDKSRAGKPGVGSGSATSLRPTSSKDMQDPNERELRKMKSAGELRRNIANLSRAASKSATSSPQRAVLSEYVTSASSSDLLNMGSPPRDSQALPKRYASLGVASGTLSPNAVRSRPQMDNIFWDNPSEADEKADFSAQTMPRRSTLPRGHPDSPRPESEIARSATQTRSSKEEKPSRWGFLKKMSMGKMRADSSTTMRSTVYQGRLHARNILVKSPGSASPGIPQIDVRISTTGALLRPAPQVVLPQESLTPSLSRKPSVETSLPPAVPEKPHIEALKVPSPSSSSHLLAPSPTPRAAKRRSFLPIDMAPIPIPAASAFVPGVTASNSADDGDDVGKEILSPVPKISLEDMQRREEERAREARVRALRSVMAYLRDMHDLGLSQTNTMSVYGSAVEIAPSGLRSRRPTVVDNGRLPSEISVSSIASGSSRPESSVQLRSTESRIGLRGGSATQTNSVATTDSAGSAGGEERKYKDDKGKRAMIIREIIETERTYVKGLQELVDIYITPAAFSVNVLSGVSQRQETVVPVAERKIVFSGLESLFFFHKQNLLPALEHVSAPLLAPKQDSSQHDVDGSQSLDVARQVAQTFVAHAAFMKMYSTYINNFDNSVQRIKAWVSDRPGTPSSVLAASSSTAQLVGLGLSMSAVSAPSVVPDSGPTSNSTAPLSSSQRKRIKSYLKRCRMNPRHSQLNLEGYLLLPVQRIPRYRLLLEELVRSSPTTYDYPNDPLERALEEISSLATSMNEGKRESESRRRLVLWQSRIRGKFPSPLVQPHRRLIMDGPLHLTRVVRKATVSFEVIDSHGDASEVQVECLSPELTPRPLIGILCNDLLVLCRDPSDGQDPNASVDLWAVLRMQTLPQPATIVHGNVDNKAILYFDAPSTSDALTWFRAINLHIPASKA
ncbi:hypothetical protein SCP_0111510 [Sparassis crispa]|uniref:DH domain-containing protein n=1 Tax=Sparassis crispa TaxID=139825 RepID=A0A401G7Z7_9APHY|nr:hypothetical protein SCP_0111510 [Sparassis crispa]GBE78268.1 hypothetical protein SCP_0111510 [Sparassis crispa]